MFFDLLPRLSDAPTPDEIDHFFSVLVRIAGPDFDIGRPLGHLRDSRGEDLFTLEQVAIIEDQFEIAFCHLPSELGILRKTINRIKDEVWETTDTPFVVFLPNELTGNGSCVHGADRCSD